MTLLSVACPSPGTCREASVSRLAGLEGEWVTAIASGAGGIWAGSAGGQVTFLSGGGRAGRRYGSPDGVPPGKINSLAVLGDKVYVGTEQGFGVFDGSSWEVIGSAEGKTLVNVFLRVEPGGKALWAGAVNLAGGLLRLEEGRWNFLGGRGKGLLNNIQAFAFQGDTAWLGSVSSGVLSMKKGDMLRAYGREQGIPPGAVFALESFAGTVWAGTSSGLVRYAEGKWAAYPKSASMPLSAVFCMAAGPDALYLGGPEGLVRHREGRFEPFPAGDSPRRIGRVNALLFHEGALYVGAADGLLRIEGW